MKHALHNLSSAEIWLDCDKYYPLKVVAEESGVEYDTAGDAAKRGTILHGISCYALRAFVSDGSILSDAIEIGRVGYGAEIQEDIELNDEDQEQVEIALTAVAELISNYRLSSINREVVVPLSHEPGGFGYIDVAAVNSEFIAVLDYKYGVVPQRPESPQLKGYAANLIDKIWHKLSDPKPKRVLLAIIQPALYREAIAYETTVRDIKKFQAYIEHLVERQKTIVNPHGATNLSTCNWCPFKQDCSAYADLVLGIVDDVDRGGLTSNEIERVYRSGSQIKKVLKSCAASIADDKEAFPNWTRAQVPNARKWNPGVDKDTIALELINAGFVDPYILNTPAKLRDQTDIGEVLKKIEKFSIDSGYHIRLTDRAPKDGVETEPAKRPSPAAVTEEIIEKAKTALKKTATKKKAAKKTAAKKRATAKVAPKKKASKKKAGKKN